MRRSLPPTAKRVLALVAALPLLGVVAPASSQAKDHRFRVRVLILTTFGGEQQPFLDRERWPLRFNLRTLRTMENPTGAIHCQTAGVCVTVVGTTKSKSGPSTVAVLEDDWRTPEGRPFDPRFTQQTTFIVAGISGIRSSAGTLGTVGIANWVVDLDLGTHFVHPGNAPPHGWLPFDEAPLTPYDQAAYHLNERLAKTAYDVAKQVPLADDDTARAERAHYGEPEASDTPSVKRCDSGGSDSFWVGRDWADKADFILRYRVRQVDPAYNGYRCASEFEDPAIAGALKRYGYLDQLIVLRTASDLEDQRPGTTPRDLYDLLHSPEGFAGYSIATENGARVALAVAHHLVAHPGKG